MLHSTPPAARCLRGVCPSRPVSWPRGEPGGIARRRIVPPALRCPWPPLQRRRHSPPAAIPRRPSVRCSAHPAILAKGNRVPVRGPPSSVAMTVAGCTASGPSACPLPRASPTGKPDVAATGPGSRSRPSGSLAGNGAPSNRRGRVLASGGGRGVVIEWLLLVQGCRSLRAGFGSSAVVAAAAFLGFAGLVAHFWVGPPSSAVVVSLVSAGQPKNAL